MRVLIIRNAYQRDTGGAEQYAFNFGLALRNAQHNPYVVTKHKSIIEKCRQKGIETINGVWYEKQEWDRLYYLRAFYTTLWYVWIILTRRINIVHPTSRDDFVFATWAARLLRKKVLWTDHGDLKHLLDREKHPHPRMQKWLLDSASYCSTIICASDSEKKILETIAPEIKDKITVIQNGVFQPVISKNIKKTKPVIGAISRLVPDKGISEILEAFASLKNFNGELWLVGSPSGNEKLYKDLAAKLGIEKRVKFIGYVNNSDDYLRQMDYFVHASYHEAFGIALAEASMAGLPIVATNVGGIPEVVKNNQTGLLVDSHDSTALASALNKLITDEALSKKLSSNARKFALEKFDFQKIVENQVLPLYNK